MAQVLPLRPHTFRLDNGLIDTYAAEMGAMGVAIYAVLQRYADRTTGQCWPSVATIARLLRLSKNCVKKYLHRLARLGLITIAPRATAKGDPTSNLYTVHEPPQRRMQDLRPSEAAAGEGTLPNTPAPERLHVLRSMPYRQYLETPEWAAIRARQLQHARYRCEVCNAAGQLNVHHRTYAHRGDEPIEDLIVLCQGCHALFHTAGKLTKPRKTRPDKKP